MDRVIRPQQLRRCADVGWTEARARAVGHAGVERDADDRDVGMADFVGAGQARES